jgi:hypothetical protein
VASIRDHTRWRTGLHGPLHRLVGCAATRHVVVTFGSPKRAIDLDAEVQQHIREGRYRDATTKAREALALREQALGPNRPEIAEGLRARLEDVVAGNNLVFPVRRLAPAGLETWAQLVERGYGGFVAKDDASRYEGGPTRRWLKVKQRNWTVEEDRWRRRNFGEDRR